MMTTVAHPLTIEEFRTRYAGAKPHYEYWFGEAVQKTVPTTLHGILQFLLMLFLDRAGYRTGSEIELRVDPEWQPKPDVLANANPLEIPYPTKTVEIVAEILSPDDPMSRVYEKCRQYERIGITKIFVFDPESQTGWEWSRDKKNLERISELDLPNGQRVDMRAIWEELERRSTLRCA